MADAECVAFLQWALPQLGRRWAGYRKVRRQVCRRVLRRMGELELDSFADYRRLLEQDPDEWPRLDAMTNITISRFYRDRAVFDYVWEEALPALADRALEAGRPALRVWSAGCASGEEAYTLRIMWELALAPTRRDLRMEVLATDIRPVMLQRAERARYLPSAMKDLPAPWREAAFRPDGDELLLLPQFRDGVTFTQHDIRSGPPQDGLFDLVLCRYLAFTYFDDAGQRETARTLARAMHPGGALVLGNREEPPPSEPGFAEWAPKLRVFRRFIEDAPIADSRQA